mmetsp:Transcript_20380/g.65116  ORF Transcript_20380/g.65116 Transcript_20380/m.65116 type:complete len:396 (+) Transcript_20380:735-1922(+)
MAEHAVVAQLRRELHRVEQPELRRDAAGLGALRRVGAPLVRQLVGDEVVHLQHPVRHDRVQRQEARRAARVGALVERDAAAGVEERADAAAHLEDACVGEGGAAVVEHRQPAEEVALRLRAQQPLQLGGLQLAARELDDPHELVLALVDGGDVEARLAGELGLDVDLREERRERLEQLERQRQALLRVAHHQRVHREGACLVARAQRVGGAAEAQDDLLEDAEAGGDGVEAARLLRRLDLREQVQVARARRQLVDAVLRLGRFFFVLVDRHVPADGVLARGVEGDVERRRLDPGELQLVRRLVRVRLVRLPFARRAHVVAQVEGAHGRVRELLHVAADGGRDGLDARGQAAHRLGPRERHRRHGRCAIQRRVAAVVARSSTSSALGRAATLGQVA